ncbi:MAG: 16S rRNA (guanine1516-N2)-methyltransferase [Cellvibrionaceae bacterium]|jgi:16S rRNA (guanine1516-N2)-methyltransferase
MLPTQHPVGIYCGSSDYRYQAEDYSRSLQLPLLDQLPATYPAGNFVLMVDASGLSLQATGERTLGPVRVDFLSGVNLHRRRYGGGKNQLIAKAIGVKAAYRPKVLDLTAGLGRDAFVLATLGCRMTMLERHPLVHFLLADGLRRGQRDDASETATIVQRMGLLHQSAKSYLHALDQPVDVIYFDPMFPSRDKSAQVKKPMVVLQQIVGSDNDAGEILLLALKKARYRVVVKRHRKAPSLDRQYLDLALPPPGFALSGKSSRFDIYPFEKLPKS